jgi:hypothetical protein
VCLPQVIKSFQNYRGVATTFYPTLVNIWSWAPGWGSIPRLTDWLTASRNVTLTLTWTDSSLGSQNSSSGGSSQKMKCVKYWVVKKLSQNRKSRRSEFRECAVEGDSKKGIRLCHEDCTGAVVWSYSKTDKSVARKRIVKTSESTLGRLSVEWLATVLYLAVVTTCECSINPITNPNPVYSH